jgi:RND family efflux transporter MFP subunit
MSTSHPKTWIKWVMLLAVLALLAAAAYSIIASRKAKSQQLAAATAAKEQVLLELAETDVVKAKMLDLAQSVPIAGSLKAVNSALVKARAAGELQGLAVREGDFVKAGQVIARIDASEYQSRLRQSQNQADSARAQVEIAQRQYDNNKALVDQGFISRTGLDTSLANLNAAQANYKAAVAATEVSAKSAADTVVRAPIAGQVSQRLAQPGERVGMDGRIVEIVDVSRLELEATLSAADSMEVRVGQSAELRIEGSARPVMARVVRINPSAQAGSRSVLAYLSIDNTEAAASDAAATSAMPLRQGLFAQGSLSTTRATLLAVPLASIRTDKPVPYIQLVENGRIVHLAVETGARGKASGGTDDEAVVAVKGVGRSLAAGATVLRGNVGTLLEGTVVRFTGQAAASDQPGVIAAPSAPAKSAP